MRRLSTMPLILAPILLVSSLAHAGFPVTSYVYTIGSLELDVGQRGSVTLDVTDIDDPLGFWTVAITYDPEVATAVDCAAPEGGTCDPESVDNAVQVTGASAEGLTSDTTLATITFECVGTGNSPLSLTSEFGSIPEEIYEIEFEDGLIACGPRAEPAATARATARANRLGAEAGRAVRLGLGRE